MCVCVCVSAFSTTTTEVARALVRACVYKYHATSERGWLLFCAAHPGDDDDVFIFPGKTFDDETGIRISEGMRKEGKRTRNNQVRARATDDVAFKHDVMLNTRKIIILLFIHV